MQVGLQLLQQLQKGHIDIEDDDEVGPHLIYLPEVAFNEKNFLQMCKNL